MPVGPAPRISTRTLVAIGHLTDLQTCVLLMVRNAAHEIGTNRKDKRGDGGGIRTPDPRIMIPLLYQLSYTATLMTVERLDLLQL